MAVSIGDYLANQPAGTNVLASNGAASGSRTAAGRTSLADSFETFLTLLTAQLKNQDPLSPMDTNNFTQQIVQMTGVEQQLLSNDLLQALLDQSTSGGNLQALSLIDRTVTARTADAALKDGEAAWTYDLGGAAASAKAEILNDKGGVVWSGDLTDLGAGQHAFAWNGRSTAGVAQADGVYSLRITAKDAAGQAMSPLTYYTAKATGLQSEGGVNLLNLGPVKVSIPSIVGVRADA